jgi:CheY-like chemotaxis protein
VPTILVVDDEEIDRVLLSSVLQKAGYEVLTAGDGRVAGEVYKRNAVDLVITDIDMPQVNGVELIQELKDQRRDLPIVAVSGSAPTLLHLAQECGATFTIRKPVSPPKLVEVVDHALGFLRPPPIPHPGY